MASQEFVKCKDKILELGSSDTSGSFLLNNKHHTLEQGHQKMLKGMYGMHGMCVFELLLTVQYI